MIDSSSGSGPLPKYVAPEENSNDRKERLAREAEWKKYCDETKNDAMALALRKMVRE